MQCVCLYVCVCLYIFLITQYLKSPAVKYKSLFFYQLANRKRDPQNLQMSIFFFLLFSWIPFLFFREKKKKFVDGAALLDSPEETHCKNHGKKLRKEGKKKK